MNATRTGLRGEASSRRGSWSLLALFVTVVSWFFFRFAGLEPGRRVGPWTFEGFYRECATGSVRVLGFSFRALALFMVGVFASAWLLALLFLVVPDAASQVLGLAIQALVWLALFLGGGVVVTWMKQKLFEGYRDEPTGLRIRPRITWREDLMAVGVLVMVGQSLEWVALR